MTRNQQRIREGANALSLNGSPLDLSRIDLFSLIDKVSTEVRLSEALRSLALPAAAVRGILRLTEPPSSSVRLIWTGADTPSMNRALVPVFTSVKGKHKAPPQRAISSSLSSGPAAPSAGATCESPGDESSRIRTGSDSSCAAVSIQGRKHPYRKPHKQTNPRKLRRGHPSLISPPPQPPQCTHADAPTVWVNDIERDPDTSTWPTTLRALLQPRYPGRLPAVRRNVFNAIFILDVTASEVGGAPVSPSLASFCFSGGCVFLPRASC